MARHIPTREEIAASRPPAFTAEQESRIREIVREMFAAPPVAMDSFIKLNSDIAKALGLVDVAMGHLTDRGSQDA